MNSTLLDVPTPRQAIYRKANLYNLINMNIVDKAKPFLKWAGGKRQLLEQFKRYFPKELSNKGEIKNFYEPFLGSGAVFFWVMQHSEIEKAYLNELNPEVYLCYVAIKNNAEEVISCLQDYAAKYKSLDKEGRKELFYVIRNKYNSTRKKVNPKKYNPKTAPKRAAMTIFLNRTCFNGLYRVNSSGDFNVPFAGYANPKICDAENLRSVSILLQKAEITNQDFSIVSEQLSDKSFVYFDPPYKPISKTASFTAYSANTFGDDEQARLACLVRDIGTKPTVKIMLSNSDPKGNYFKKLYAGFRIEKVTATRLINCVAEKRGKVSEILVMNYKK